MVGHGNFGVPAEPFVKQKARAALGMANNGKVHQELNVRLDPWPLDQSSLPMEVIDVLARRRSGSAPRWIQEQH
jgi:hypothetical protein